MRIGAVIPVKNESGNAEKMVLSAKRLTSLTQILFIDGNSTDNTARILRKSINEFGDHRMKLLIQSPPFTKFNAVQQGIRSLNTDHVIIWDGDNTIQYEDVESMLEIYESESKKGNIFLVANRLNIQREDKSFRTINLVGNYIFSFMMIPVIKANLKDVLSGVKIFPHFLVGMQNCPYICKSDLYGDISLLSFGRKASLNFIQFSCNYKQRTYGESKISRFYGGVNILKSILHLYQHRCYHP